MRVLCPCGGPDATVTGGPGRATAHETATDQWTAAARRTATDRRTALARGTAAARRTAVAKELDP